MPRHAYIDMCIGIYTDMCTDMCIDMIDETQGVADIRLLIFVHDCRWKVPRRHPRPYGMAVGYRPWAVGHTAMVVGYRPWAVGHTAMTVGCRPWVWAAGHGIRLQDMGLGCRPWL